MKDVKKCEDCGHSMREHLCDFNRRVNCQVCERKGLTCDWKDISQNKIHSFTARFSQIYGDKDWIGCENQMSLSFGRNEGVIRSKMHKLKFLTDWKK